MQKLTIDEMLDEFRFTDDYDFVRHFIRFRVEPAAKVQGDGFVSMRVFAPNVFNVVLYPYLCFVAADPENEGEETYVRLRMPIEMLRKLNVHPQKIFTDFCAAGEEIDPSAVSYLADEELTNQPDVVESRVVTTMDAFFGLAVVFYNGFLQRIANGRDLYVVPISESFAVVMDKEKTDNHLEYARGHIADLVKARQEAGDIIVGNTWLYESGKDSLVMAAINLQEKA